MRSLIGYAAPRRDGFAKVTGRAQYVGDLSFPLLAVGRLLRSPHPHAQIIRLDTTVARTAPGVLAVLTVDEVLPYEQPLARFVDQPLLARGRVRYEGEPIAAVAAIDALSAEEALEQIDVVYDALPEATTLENARRPGAPMVHEELTGAEPHQEGLRPIVGSNVLHTATFTSGDGAAALEHADVVVEETYRYPAVHHYAMEAPVVVAEVSGGRCTVWASTRRPFVTREEIAARFGFPATAVRVIVPYVGGAYGSKSAAKLEALAVALALAAGRPVTLVSSIQEGFRTVTGHEVVVEIASGARRDGQLLARRTRVFVNLGAYADVGPTGPRIAASTAFRSAGPYRIPHLDLQGFAVYTNTVPGGALRGYGAAQVAWAYEAHTDALARRLGMDPVQFRLRNLLRQGEPLMPKTHPMDSDISGSVRRVSACVRKSRVPFHGRGVAVGAKDSAGNRTLASAIVRLHVDGSATVLASAVESGQGAQTVLAQIAAEELSLPLDRVQVALPDTMLTPFDQGTGSSGSTIVVGHAIRMAAADARRQLLDLARRVLNTTSAVRLSNGTVRAGKRMVTIAELLTSRAQMSGGELIGRGAFQNEVDGRRAVYWETGTTAVQVVVDPETGVVTPLRVATGLDAGRAINPALVEGQDEGAMMMGLGPALFEEAIYDGGQMLTASLLDYRVPLMSDLPDAGVETVLIEAEDGPGPYGAKGAGESGILGIAPAIAAAVGEATGVYFTELPISPERVYWALRGRKEQ